MAWLTSGAVAEALGVDYYTVTRWLRAGRIRGARKVGRKWLIPSDWIDDPKLTPLEVVQAQRAGSQPQPNKQGSQSQKSRRRR